MCSSFNNKKNSIIISQSKDEYKSRSLNFTKIRDSINCNRYDQLIYTSIIIEIMTRFFIQNNQMEILFKKFKELDVTKSGFLKINDLFYLINENPNKSIVSFFLGNFFISIEKKDNNKITFEEFIPYLISYCIYNQDQIKEFIFNILDTNNNLSITRNEIIRLFSSKVKLFTNYTQAIRNYQFNQSDQITLEDFIEMCNNLPFIYYPAMKLQSLFRTNYIGEEFWSKLQSHISKNYRFSNYKKRKPIIDKINIDKISNKLEQYDKQAIKIYEREIRLKDGYFTDTDFFRKKKKTKLDVCNSLDVNIYN